jgi:hypothetical protein
MLSPRATLKAPAKSNSTTLLMIASTEANRSEAISSHKPREPVILTKRRTSTRTTSARRHFRLSAIASMRFTDSRCFSRFLVS